MKTSDFDYHLPQHCIAQTPVEPRHTSRLLILDRKQDQIEHSTFWDIDEHLRPGDLLVINQTRVIPARIFAHKPTGGKVELLLLKQVDKLTWEVLIGGKKIHPGQQLIIENGPQVEILAPPFDIRGLVYFSEPIEPYLDRVGQMPLPPYIHTRLENPERYQTVYASTPGSTAAPTAGLHFTRELMDHLEQRGVRFARLTLHVGLDTFAPVTEEEVESHHIHTEWCELTPETAQVINTTHEDGGRIIAIGTTSVRTLETAGQTAAPDECVDPYLGPTGLFITPGYRFRVVDAMVTNFHLPRSTLIMLVSAFAGRERILEAYNMAVEMGYRFYSFGDVMLML